MSTGRAALASASAEQLTELVSLLGTKVLTGAAQLAAYSRDASRAVPEGLPAAVVRAESSQDVQQAIRWAAEHAVPVSVRGAGTGLSGGAVGYPGGLVVSLEAMNRILELDAANRVAVVEPGVVVAELDAAAAAQGLMYAPDPASYQSCTIGGTVATNAGGLRCLAHGVTRDAIAGLEVVLADGRLIRTGSRTRKNSTGYELTGLFIGSEGTLGVVTRVTVRLKPRPVTEPVTFLAEFVEIRDAGRAVSAIMNSPVTPELLELMDRSTVEAVERHFPSGMAVLGAAMLVGQCVGPAADEEARLIEQLCRMAGAIRLERGAGDELLRSRRMANPALSASGLRASCDVAVPPSRLAEMFERIEGISARTGVRISTFAHAGDGNMHPSVEASDDSPESMLAAEEILDAITEAALELGGVISGEHGIGSLKRGLIERQFDADTLAVQHELKHWLDPQGILTPGRAI